MGKKIFFMPFCKRQICNTLYLIAFWKKKGRNLFKFSRNKIKKGR